MVVLRSVVLLMIISSVNRCRGYVWQNQPCSIDHDEQMPEGVQENISRFPWLGVVQHTFYLAGKSRYAITGAVLIHPVYAIASAEDIAKIFPQQIKNNTQLFFWGRPNPKEVYSLDVKDYILHPEYKEKLTAASIALLGLIRPEEAAFSEFQAPVLPVCLPLVGGGAYDEMYAAKLTDQSGTLEKEVFKMEYVLDTYCEDFYWQNEIHYNQMNPLKPLCAVSVYNKTVCVWDAGTALIVKQAWGFWQLIGFAVRGPGCGAPTKFLNIHDYLPWINDVITRTPTPGTDDSIVIGMRRNSPQRIVLYNAYMVPRYLGQCKKGERGSIIYKDLVEIRMNKDYSIGFYYLSVSQVASFLCAEIHMIEATRRSNNAVWVEQNCHNDISGSAIQGQPRSGDMRRLECFLYFKSTAFIEFRYTFSFKVIISVVLYGKVEQPPKMKNIFRQTQPTTNWWPTAHNSRLRSGYFVPQNLWWYNL